MGDPKLVEEVLGEEWRADDEAVSVGVRVVADFWRYEDDSTRVVVERARQAALGHRALKLLVERHSKVVEMTGECLQMPGCEACAIIRELRGES